MTKNKRPIDLDDLLTAKLLDWYADPSDPQAEQLREACRFMTSMLSNVPSSEIIDANSANGAVLQFRHALDSCNSWHLVEEELRAMTPKEVDELQFPDLVHHLSAM